MAMPTTMRMHKVPDLTDEQKQLLSEAYAEYCGADPNDQADWKVEMAGAKRFIRELMAFFRKRNRVAKED